MKYQLSLLAAHCPYYYLPKQMLQIRAIIFTTFVRALALGSIYKKMGCSFYKKLFCYMKSLVYRER